MKLFGPTSCKGDCQLNTGVDLRIANRGPEISAIVVGKLAEPLKGRVTVTFAGGRKLSVEWNDSKLPAMPLIPNGEGARGVLSAPGAKKPATAVGVAAPRTALQMDLARIWQESLGVKRVGIEENFFDIGGDSLSAMRIVVRMRRLLNLDFPVACLFENPTIESLALTVEGMQSSMHSEADLLRMLEEIDSMPLSNAESE
jgi:aryl carrier-like protein